jgi:hypothetical protein
LRFGTDFNQADRLFCDQIVEAAKTAVKTLDRKEVVSNGEVTVTWKIAVKACNPDCR